MVNETVKKVPAKKATKKVVKKKVDASANGEDSPPAQFKGRDILYPLIVDKICEKENALTQEQAKALLGWREAEKDEEYLFIDLEGKKIVCTNNRNNRPFYRSNADTIMQEILRGNWVQNCEHMIIGLTGLIISAQHRLIGFILACQAWNKDKDKYEYWTQEPTLDCCICFGCSEEEKIINTIDTGKYRSLTDVLYRSELFRDFKSSQRKTVARICDYAVRTLWARTGVANAFSMRRTHAESLDFLSRHPKVLDCVRYIYEDSDGAEESLVFKYTRSLGLASGLMYLMAASNSDWAKYAPVRVEDALDLSNFEKASEFWTMLATKDKKIRAVHTAMVALSQRNAPISERVVLLIKAWLLFIEGKPIAAEKLQIKYKVDDDGVETLNEFPLIGGIDCGVKGEEVEDDESIPDPSFPATPQEQEQPKGEPSIKVNDHVWVIEESGGHWCGVVTEFVVKKGVRIAMVKVDQGFAGAGKIEEALAAQLQKDKPNDSD